MRGAVGDVLTTLRGKTARDTQTVFLSQIVNAAIGFAFNVLLIRKLEFEDYGLFSLFMSAVMLFNGVMNCGWTETFVRFSARHEGEFSGRAFRRFFLKRVVACAALVGGAGLAFGPWIASGFYGRSDFLRYFQAALATALVMTIFNFHLAYYRASRKFAPFSALQIAVSAARLIGGLALLALGFLSLRSLVGLQIVTTFAFMGVVFWMTRERGPERPGNTRIDGRIEAVRGDIRKFHGWLMLSSLSTQLFGNLDTQFLARFQGNAVLARYGAAGRLSAPFLFFLNALSATAMPRLSAAKTKNELRRFFSAYLWFSGAASIAMAVAVIWAPPLLSWVAGAKYAGLDVLLRIQFANLWVILLVNPIGVLLLAQGLTRETAFLNLVQLAVSLSLYLTLIPKWGANGAAATCLCASLIGMGFTLYLSRKVIAKAA